MQKLNSRTAALAKTTAIPEGEKGKFKESLLGTLMSSEDSDDSGSFDVRPLPWRSHSATDFFNALDKKHEKRLSQKSRMMMYSRKQGLASDRPKPATGSVPAWCLKGE